ncbi:MAG: T9SS type A sorting domain-containing protein, partial [Chitinophagales bacterium]
ILERSAGAIGYLGGVSFYEDFDQTKDFHIRFYDLLSNENYGQSVGVSLHQLFEENQTNTSIEDEPYLKLIGQHLTYVGDPSICLFAGNQTDYVVEEEDIQIINPNTGEILDKVTPFMSEFMVEVLISNLGKASDDSIDMKVVRTLSNGEEITLSSKKIVGPSYQKTYYIYVQNDVFEGDGMNEISVVLDQKDKVSESCEDNNFSKKTLQIEGNCDMSETIAAIDEVVIMNDNETANLSLADINEDYLFEWSDGSDESSLEITEQGIYTVNITDDLGCNVEKTFKVYPNDLVYPGDANYDGIANMYDLLYIGLAYDYEGDVREETDIYDWNGQPSFDWDIDITEDENGEILENSLNTKHSDSNGDGLVNSDDIAAIKANYNHLIGKKAALAESEMALYVEATDTIIPGYEHVFAVNLGTENQPAEDLYGIAFTAEFTLAEVGENDTVQLNAPMATFGNSWLGEKGVDMITVDTVMMNSLTWDVALSRNDRIEKTNYGALCNLGCIMVIGSLKSAGAREIPINMTLKNVVMTRADGTKLQLKSSKRTFIIAEQLATSIDDIDDTFTHLNMSPNPANNLVYLDFNDYQPQASITEINLYNLTGQLMHHQQKTVRNDERVTLDLMDLPQGMYWVQIVNGANQVTKKLVVAK